MKREIILTLFLTLISLSTIAQQSSDFRGIHFDTVADFTDFKFETAALFDKAQFDSSAIFINAKFNSIAYFRKTGFNSSVLFDKAHFIKSTDFTNVQFDSSVRFHYTKFDEFACFKSATFKSIAYFGATHFDSIAYFRNATFNNTANFDHAHFHVLADFIDVVFDSIVIFDSAHFYNLSRFNGASLPYLLDLSGVFIDNEEIDLTVAKINPVYGVCKINLANSNIDKIIFKYSRFELYFPDSTDVETKTTVYEKLLLKQKKEGFIKSYEKLDKEYKEFWYLEGGGYGNIWGFVQNFFSKYWWGYGYEKVRIFKNTFYLFIFFFLINTIIWLRNKGPKIYEVPHLQIMRESVIHASYLKKVLKSFYISFFYTSIVFFGLKFGLERLNYDNNNIRFKKCRLIGFFILYLSGIICLAYLANFVLSN